jgi:hypothetical protein
MAITKRTRFEILRRDNHTCQYCGEKAPDVVLHIDHVVPVALGGDDKPGNLVAACKDCNAGKSSIQPDSPLVQGLSAEAAAYALGMTDKMTRFRADLESLDDYADEFHEVWDRWTVQGEAIELPVDYRASLFRWMTMGVPVSIFELAIPPAHRKYNQTPHMKQDAIFGYTAGVVWNMVNAREIDHSVTSETASVYTASEYEAYGEEQWWAGRGREGRAARRTGHHWAQDIVQAHIDGTTTPLIDQFRSGAEAPWEVSASALV